MNNKEREQDMPSKIDFIVITGGPGVGKTTLLEALRARGCQYVSEVARAIIKEQVQCGGDALPWKNKTMYARLMLERSVESYTTALNKGSEGTLFFDRGIPDTLAYCRLTQITVPEELLWAVGHHRYHEKVFILPPWKEIYTTDNERKQDFEEAEETFCVMRETYKGLGYKVIEVPKMEPGERAEFVLKHIGLVL